MDNAEIESEIQALIEGLYKIKRQHNEAIYLLNEVYQVSRTGRLKLHQNVNEKIKTFLEKKGKTV